MTKIHSVSKAELQIHYDIFNINNPKKNVTKNDLDIVKIIQLIKVHLKSIPSIIHVEVYINIDMVIITFIGKLPIIPPLIIPYMNGCRVIISFELIRIINDGLLD